MELCFYLFYSLFFFLNPLNSTRRKEKQLFLFFFPPTLLVCRLSCAGVLGLLYILKAYFSTKQSGFTKQKDFHFHPILSLPTWPDRLSSNGGKHAVPVRVAVPYINTKRIAASGHDWMQRTRDMSVSFNYLKAQVTHPATFCVSPQGDFLSILANAQESDVQKVTFLSL